jgi:hypothetical protein
MTGKLVKKNIQKCLIRAYGSIVLSRLSQIICDHYENLNGKRFEENEKEMLIKEGNYLIPSEDEKQEKSGQLYFGNGKVPIQYPYRVLCKKIFKHIFPSFKFKIYQDFCFSFVPKQMSWFRIQALTPKYIFQKKFIQTWVPLTVILVC